MMIVLFASLMRIDDIIQGLHSMFLFFIVLWKMEGPRVRFVMQKACFSKIYTSIPSLSSHLIKIFPFCGAPEAN